MNEFKLKPRYGYMYGLWLAEKKGWVYSFFDSREANGKRFSNVGLLGGIKWRSSGEWEFVFVGEHDLVMDFGEKIIVHYADGGRTEITEHIKRLEELK